MTARPANATIAWVGRIGGPLLALSLYLLLARYAAGLNEDGRATAAISVLMAVWWMTESLPLPVTALLPLVLFPLAGVLTTDEAAAPYADKNIFLFMGGFLIALAVERWNLHRRIALLVVLAVGTSPRKLVGGVMLATALLSMWMSNTATTAMMLPIGMSLVALLRQQLHASSSARESSERTADSVQGVERDASPPAGGEPDQAAQVSTCLMLGIAYAASIGGLATLVGTPTNLLLAGFADRHGLSIGFAEWLVLAAPLAGLYLVIAWLLLTYLVFPIRIGELPGGRKLIRDELARLGRPQRGEWTVGLVFTMVACAWVVRGPLNDWSWLVARVPAAARLDDTIIAMAGAIVLFVIPVDTRRGQFALDWSVATRLPWGVLLLFGGGFSLAAAVARSGLAEWIGSSITALDDWPPLALVTVVVTLMIFLTELTSNTPTAAAFLPILFGAAQAMALDPLLLLIPATLAASCAFMLPVATPPNAIVFASGEVPIRAMIRAGIWLNLVGIVLIPIYVATLRAGAD